MPPTDPERRADLRRLLRAFFALSAHAGPRAVPPDTGIDARQMLRDKRTLFRFGLPGNLLFLFRLRFGLSAVLARLGAVADWAALEADLLRMR